LRAATSDTDACYAVYRMPGTYKHIYKVVKRIPRGRVATYGQIAELAGMPKQPRQIGYALSALEDDASVPWHRVINAKGQISQRSFISGCESNQRKLLEAEGVVFDDQERVDLKQYRWKPRAVRAKNK